MKYLQDQEEKLFPEYAQRIHLIQVWFEMVKEVLGPYEIQAFKDIMQGVTKLKDERD